MSNLRNSVQLIGRLGKDPEIRTFESGRKKASFSLATSESYVNQKGEKVDETQWHNIVIWGNLAETAADQLKKGQEVELHGKITYRNYETSTGEKRYITEINVNDLKVLATKS